DYDCPDGAGEWARTRWPCVRTVSVRERPSYNASAARNLGAAAASAPWLLFLDADVIAPPDLAERLRPLARPGSYAVADPRPSELCGAILVAAADFERIGGFDEAFEGWGSEDLDLLARLDLAGLARATFPASWLEVIWHDDAARTRFHATGDRRIASAVNALYAQAKLDLLRLGETLNLAPRRPLHAE